MKHFAHRFSVPGNHPSLPGHFPGHPIVPGVLLLDHVLTALQQATGRRVARLLQVKFMSPLRPDEEADALFELDGTRASFRVTAQRDGTDAMLASGVLSLQSSGGPTP